MMSFNISRRSKLPFSSFDMEIPNREVAETLLQASQMKASSRAGITLLGSVLRVVIDNDNFPTECQTSRRDFNRLVGGLQRLADGSMPDSLDREIQARPELAMSLAVIALRAGKP